MKKLILASASPRRRDLLRSLGLDFEVYVTDADENINVKSPSELVRVLAERKAEAAASVYPDCVVIAADTVVSHDGEILGKPHDDADAARMLRMLSGSSHTVYTGVCVIADGATASETVATDVRMRNITEEEISDYIRTGEPRDKAGAYGIQGLGGIFVERIDGDYFNVTGMPKEATARLLAGVGVDILKLQANE